MASSDSDSDSDGGCKLRKDEYGEPFEDYGFLKRAEEFKASGNADFKKERYEKAMKEYGQALDQLITVEHDKSLVIGKQKWSDVVVLRSTIHLNISTCHLKLNDWQMSLAEANSCLVGTIREQGILADPNIRKKIEAAQKKDGKLAMQFCEDRLPRALRAKAWFRVSQCNASLDYLDRARDAMARAVENCADERLQIEISQHSLKLDTLEKEQRGRQKKQFAGFFDKLQDSGGYIDGRRESFPDEDQKALPPTVGIEQRLESDRLPRREAFPEEDDTSLQPTVRIEGPPGSGSSGAGRVIANMQPAQRAQLEALDDTD